MPSPGDLSDPRIEPGSPASQADSLLSEPLGCLKLNKQSDNVLNQPIVLCPVLTVATWPANRFLRRQVTWSDIPVSLRIFQFVVIHTVKGFGVVNKAEVDVEIDVFLFLFFFLELLCFYDDPADVGNLISGSSAFSKSSLNIWKFTVHILLKPDLENFEQYFASVFHGVHGVAKSWTRLSD